MVVEEMALNLTHLTEEERSIILNVLHRDDELQKQENSRIKTLKDEIQCIRKNSAIKPGDDPAHTCTRCHRKLGIIFDSGDLCPRCHSKVCSFCREDLPNKRWVCILCHKQIQFRGKTGRWFYDNVKKKFADDDVTGISRVVRESIRRSKAPNGETTINNNVTSSEDVSDSGHSSSDGRKFQRASPHPESLSELSETSSHVEVRRVRPRKDQSSTEEDEEEEQETSQTQMQMRPPSARSSSAVSSQSEQTAAPSERDEWSQQQQKGNYYQYDEVGRRYGPSPDSVIENPSYSSQIDSNLMLHEGAAVPTVLHPDNGSDSYSEVDYTDDLSSVDYGSPKKIVADNYRRDNDNYDQYYQEPEPDYDIPIQQGQRSYGRNEPEPDYDDHRRHPRLERDRDHYHYYRVNNSQYVGRNSPRNSPYSSYSNSPATNSRFPHEGTNSLHDSPSQRLKLEGASSSASSPRSTRAGILSSNNELSSNVSNPSFSDSSDAELSANSHRSLSSKELDFEFRRSTPVYSSDSSSDSEDGTQDFHSLHCSDGPSGDEYMIRQLSTIVESSEEHCDLEPVQAIDSVDFQGRSVQNFPLSSSSQSLVMESLDGYEVCNRGTPDNDQTQLSVKQNSNPSEHSSISAASIHENDSSNIESSILTVHSQNICHGNDPSHSREIVAMETGLVEDSDDSDITGIIENSTQYQDLSDSDLSEIFDKTYQSDDDGNYTMATVSSSESVTAHIPPLPVNGVSYPVARVYTKSGNVGNIPKIIVTPSLELENLHDTLGDNSEIVDSVEPSDGSVSSALVQSDVQTATVSVDHVPRSHGVDSSCHDSSESDSVPEHSGSSHDSRENRYIPECSAPALAYGGVSANAMHGGGNDDTVENAIGTSMHSEVRQDTMEGIKDVGVPEKEEPADSAGYEFYAANSVGTPDGDFKSQLVSRLMHTIHGDQEEEEEVEEQRVFRRDLVRQSSSVSDNLSTVFETSEPVSCHSSPEYESVESCVRRYPNAEGDGCNIIDSPSEVVLKWNMVDKVPSEVVRKSNTVDEVPSEVVRKSNMVDEACQTPKTKRKLARNAQLISGGSVCSYSDLINTSPPPSPKLFSSCHTSPLSANFASPPSDVSVSSQEKSKSRRKANHARYSRSSDCSNNSTHKDDGSKEPLNPQVIVSQPDDTAADRQSLASEKSESRVEVQETQEQTEGENIDDLVAAHRSYHGSRSNLNTSLATSITSIASNYSEAGANYGRIPVTGDILFAIEYNYKVGSLEINVKKCRDLAAADVKKNRSDSYVKTYLLPNKTKASKRKTHTKKNSLDPVFDEVLRYTISQSELETRTLWLSVWHSAGLGRNDFLGEVMIPFEDYEFKDTTPQWHTLVSRHEAPSQMLSYKGEMSIAIKYVTAENVSQVLSKKSGRTKKAKADQTPGDKGELHVLIKNAKDLTAVKTNNTSDPFCKGYLLPDKTSSGKQKTLVCRKTCNPEWLHTFIYGEVTLFELKECCLELTVWDHERLTTNDFLGGLRLSLGLGKSYGSEVEWMDSLGDEVIIWQSMLQKPNTWVEATMALRPTMDSR